LAPEEDIKVTFQQFFRQQSPCHDTLLWFSANKNGGINFCKKKKKNLV